MTLTTLSIKMITIKKKKNEKSNLNFVKEFDIDGIKFNVKICEGEDLKKFMKENKSHLEFCLKHTNNKNKKRKKTNTILNESVYLGVEEFKDLAKIKEKINKLMREANDKMIVLNEEQTKFIKDLVKYHPDKKIREKKDSTFIGVGKLNEHEYKKGFFGLDENKEKLYNFLIYKCPEKIMAEDRKLKKNN